MVVRVFVVQRRCCRHGVLSVAHVGACDESGGGCEPQCHVDVLTHTQRLCRGYPLAALPGVVPRVLSTGGASDACVPRRYTVQDFKGQLLAEQLYQYVLLGFSVRLLAPVAWAGAAQYLLVLPQAAFARVAHPVCVPLSVARAYPSDDRVLSAAAAAVLAVCGVRVAPCDGALPHAPPRCTP